nr:uncharacterized protein LOC128691346 [Cherax quadricarinatus]
MIDHVDPDLNLHNLTPNQNLLESNCLYYTASQASTILNNAKSLSVLNYNIRSLSKHYDDLLALLESLKTPFSCIILTETWLKQDTIDIYPLPGYTAIHNCRPNQVGGGIAIYYSNQLSCISTTCFSDEYGEYIFANFTVKNLKTPITICAIYRIPHTNIPNFSEKLKSLITNRQMNQHHLLLAGDFNINLGLLDDQPVTDFINNMNNTLLIPTITKPTRLTETSATIIDHIWINILAPLKSGIITDSTTDHYPTFLLTNINKPPLEYNKVSFRLHDEASIRKFTADLETVDWPTEFSKANGIYDWTDILLNKLLRLYNKHCSIKTKQITNKRLGCPWLTSTILKSIDKKHQYEKQYRQGLIHKDILKHYSSVLTKVIKKAKELYYSSSIVVGLRAASSNSLVDQALIHREAWSWTGPRGR